MPTKKAKKTAKAKPCVTAMTTFHDDVITERHYIVNGFPECIDFWTLANKLTLITEDELIKLIRLNIDVIYAVKCNGCCTVTVTQEDVGGPRSRNSPYKWTTRKKTVKAPSCDGKCTIHIKRIL